MQLHNGLFILQPTLPGQLFSVVQRDFPSQAWVVGLPAWEINHEIRKNFAFSTCSLERALPHGGVEQTLIYLALGSPDLRLEVTLRSFPGSPILRFRYRLSAAAPARLTKVQAKDQLLYTTLEIPTPRRFSEISLSQFDPVLHSYLPDRRDTLPEEVFDRRRFAGPLLLVECGAQTLLLGYEHGADYPRSFLEFQISQDPHWQVSLSACQGNYFDGQPLGPEHFWISPWIEIGIFPGTVEESLPRYRQFILEEMSSAPATRRPRICYNTWNFQERNHLYNDRPYLESMNLERMLAEIDAAHTMGIDTFVIDTGWYNRTGDWQVDTQRFPDGLRQVRERLQGYAMELGLWFNPTAAALTSQVYRANPANEITWDSAPSHFPVWETEVSAGMCLASDYSADFIQIMLRLREELGVTYFKWDGIGQDGCNSPLHHHGTADNPAEERAACYAFQMGLQMIHMAEALSERYPETVVDFDVTECGRFVGLGFLSAGHYFLINNASYAKDFDTPEKMGLHPWMNMFFYPGPARARVCRRGYLYDSILPAHLMLTHFLPDGPRTSQENNLASLVLGGNGLWGDLLDLSAEDISFWSASLQDYKQVWHAAARAYPRVSGAPGFSPEVHEKIDPQTAAGLVAFFTFQAQRVEYVTQALDAGRLVEVKGADAWEILPDGRVKLTVDLSHDGARTVFFLGSG